MVESRTESRPFSRGGFWSLLVVAIVLGLAVAVLRVPFWEGENNRNQWTVNSNSTVSSSGGKQKSELGIVTCHLGTSGNELVHLLGLVHSLSRVANATTSIAIEVYHDPSTNPISLWMEMQMEEECPRCRISFHPIAFAFSEEQCLEHVARTSAFQQSLYVNLLEGPVALSSSMWNMALENTMSSSSRTTLVHALHDWNSTERHVEVRTNNNTLVATLGIGPDNQPLWFQGTAHLSGVAVRHWLVQDPNCTALSIMDDLLCTWILEFVFQPHLHAQQALSMDRSSDTVEWVMYGNEDPDEEPVMVASSVVLVPVPPHCNDACRTQVSASVARVLPSSKLKLILFQIDSNGDNEEVASRLQIVKSIWSEVEQPGLEYAIVFSESDTDLPTLAFPRHLELLQEEEGVPFFVHVPSGLACIRLVSWIRTMSGWKNRQVAGCIVVLDGDELWHNWEEVAQHTTNISSTLLSTTNQSIYQICHALSTDEVSWRNRYKNCMDAGFDVIHTPFPREQVDVSLSAEDPAALMGNTFQTKLDNTIAFQIGRQMEIMNLTNYLSSWAVAFPPNWKDRSTTYFSGSQLLSQAPEKKKVGQIWRCVTKAISVMLVLRLEELGLVDLDRPLTRTGAYARHPLSLRMIVTNSAGKYGQLEGKEFAYKNQMWVYVQAAVENATGLSFLDAANHFVVDRMGLSGNYNSKTEYEPLIGRGFEGGLDDVLLVGSTLANGGISPKTGKRIVSAASIQRMLSDYTVGHKDSFYQDHTVYLSRMYLTPYGVDAFGNYSGSFEDETDPNWLVFEGYGMGIWLTSALRTWDARGAMGLGSDEILLYFDDTGLVLASLSEEVSPLHLWGTFVEIIYDVGDYISEWTGIPHE